MVASNGEFTVAVLKGSEWREVGKFSCDRLFRERKLDIGAYISGDGPVKVRLVQKGGGAAHLDGAFLDGKPPVEISGSDEALALRKLAKIDFDVIDAFGKSIDLVFPAPRSDKTLRMTARVEEERISETPFLFPLANLFQQITPVSQFYTYRLKAGTVALPADGGLKESEPPFFKEWSIAGTGHPSGFTYGWVGNDDKNLYVKIDFTPDDTMDGGKDYAKVFVKTDASLKEFKLAVPETNWGVPSFTYTDKVAYQHKVYDFKIPLKEIGIKGATDAQELKLAFAAYGTASPHLLTALSAGNGAGALTSVTFGITCAGTSCSGMLDPYASTQAVIVATPANGASTKWIGCDWVEGTECGVNAYMNNDRKVYAVFTDTTLPYNEWRPLRGLSSYGTYAYEISANGGTVVGETYDADYNSRAFRWTLADGMADLGTLPGGGDSWAYGVSADGGVVVGEARDSANNWRAFRWTQADGMVDLGTPPGGGESWVYGVSADGGVIVGEAAFYDNIWHALRWTVANGMVDLGTLGGTYSGAYGVSADGAVVVGQSEDSAGSSRPFRWTAAGGMVDLGTLGGGTGWANAASADGGVVVGASYPLEGNKHAFRWTEATGIIDLGTLTGGTYSEAYGVSADGSVIVGESTDSDGNTRAFRWTQASGMQTINQWLAGHGVNTATVDFESADGVSANGTVVAGSLVEETAFIARVASLTPLFDTIPDPFTFSLRTGVALATVIQSDVITVTGIDAPAPISVAGGEYSVNGGAFASSSGTVNNNDTVAIRLTSSEAYGAQSSATLSIGGVTGKFSVITLLPPSFSLTVTKSGSGSGTVTSVVGGIDCGGACSSTPLVAGSYVTLTAYPDEGSLFTGWSSSPTACSGSYTTCTFPIAADTTVTATFIKEIFLQGNYVEVGINAAGSFGTNVNAPPGFHPMPEEGETSGSLGFVADPGKDGWGVGTPPQTGDYFVPGSPEEGWMVQWGSGNGTPRPFPNFGLRGAFAVPVTALTDTSAGDTRSAIWEGVASAGDDRLRVTQTVSFNVNDLFFTMNVVLTNIGTTTLNSLEYMRNVDPDQEEPITGDYTTRNWVEFQPPRSGDSGRPELAAIPAGNTNKALTVARGLVHGLTLGLGTIDPRAVVAASHGFSNRDPDEILNYPNQPLAASPSEQDSAIVLAYDLGSLAPGQSTSITYAYILNAADLETAMGNLAAVTILQPTGTVSGKGIIFQATTNKVAETTKIDFYANGNPVGTSSTPDAGGVFATTFDSTVFANGTVTLKVVATFANDSTVEKTTTVTVGNAGPPIEFTAPSAGQIFSGSGIAVAINALDSEHPPARVSFFRETAGTGSIFLGEVTTAPFATTFGVTDLPPGETVVIKAVATDSLDRATTKSVSGSVLISYTLDFISGANGTVSGTTSQTVNWGGSTTSVTANPAAGYHFVNWTGDNGFVTTTDNPLTVNNVTANTTITANFALDTYHVTFTKSGFGGISGSSSQTVNWGGSTTAVTALNAVGYHFVNWTGNNGFVTTTANPLTVNNVTADMIITANFAPDVASQTITFNTLSARTYGDSDFDPGATASSGLVVSYASSDTSVAIIVSGKVHIVGSGTTTITASQIGDASHLPANDATQVVTVNKAVLNVTVVNTTKFTGSDNPVFTANYSGFVDGDGVSILSGAPVFSTTAGISSSPGAYDITISQGTLAAANYSFTFKNGVLSVKDMSTDSEGRTFAPIVLDDVPGTRVEIPEGTSLRDANGNPLSGGLTISSHSHDSISALSKEALVGEAADGSSLVSLGASIDLTVTAGKGAVKKIDPPMTVSLTVPPSYAAPGTMVQYYSFDGTSWQYEGEARVKGDGKVDMKVGHLSLWAVGAFKQLPKGDMNKDGLVDISDALKIMKIAIQAVQPTADDYANGDVAPIELHKPAPDGKIDLGDAVVLLRKAVGLPW